MGNAKSRQMMNDGRHGNGRVNIEIAPVLGSGAKSKEDDWNADFYFHHVSYFLTTAFPSKNNIAHRKYMYWHLVAMFVNTRAIRTNPATVTTLTERGLLRQNDTNLESPVPTPIWPPKLP